MRSAGATVVVSIGLNLAQHSRGCGRRDAGPAQGSEWRLPMRGERQRGGGMQSRPGKLGEVVAAAD